MARTFVFLEISAVLIVATFGVGYFVLGTRGTASSTSVNTSTTSSTFAETSFLITGMVATTATAPTNSLELRLYLNTSSSSGPGVSVSMFADAYNPSSSTANVTAANDWVVPLGGTDGAPCGDEGQTVGFAIAQGYYTSSTITAAKLLDLVNPSATYNCPIYFGYGSATGFLFQPMSDGGASYGCIGVSPRCLTGNATATYNLFPLTVTGYYQGDTFTGFPQGTYTVLAEDEWGALVLAYFEVSSVAGEANTVVATVTLTTTVIAQASKATTIYVAPTTNCTEMPLTVTSTITTTTTLGASSTTTMTATATSTSYTQTVTVTSCTGGMSTVTSTVTTTTKP